MNHNLQQTEHTKKRYNATSSVYNIVEWPVEQLWYKKWRQKLCEQIHGPLVLEIGVGTGKNIPYYPEGIELTGIDPSPGMLKQAKKILSTRKEEIVILREMDAQQMDFPDQTFDEVVATFVFCSVPDPILGLKEALRVTRTGGRLHLLEHMRSENRLLGWIMDRLDASIHYLSGVHIARQTVKNVEKAGWKINVVQDLVAGGIFRRIEAVKTA